MAHKKSGWTAQNVHDSPWQRLWIKKYAGQRVVSWNILVRQRWTKWCPWNWTEMWKDFTIFAVSDWIVYFTEKRQLKFNWRVYRDIFVHVSETGKPEARKPATKKVKVEKKSAAKKPAVKSSPAAKKAAPAKKKSAEKKPAAKKTTKKES